MNTNISKTLDELKTIVMALHRSAGQLDELIQTIEFEVGENDKEFMAILIKQCQNCRDATKKRKGYSELDEMENDIWARLLTDAHEES